MAVPTSNTAQLRGALSLASQLFDQGTARVHEFHRAISDIPVAQVPKVLGVATAAKPVQQTHDAITDGVYLGIRAVASALFRTADAAVAVHQRNFPQTAAVPVSSKGAELMGAVSGLIGDDMARSRNPLTPRMGFYQQGQRIALTEAGVTAAFPAASGKLAIFAHGLCGSEHTWNYFQQPGDAETLPYSERLHTELGFTPVMLRYNTGLHISLNGRTAARQLQKLLAHWPVPVSEVVFIGHSMGGLLARSTVYAGMKANMSWTRQVSHIVCLGSPHTGAPLERVVDKGVALMQKFGLSRPLAKVLDVRSVGIRDLGHGYVVDEDWKGRERATLNADSRTPIPRLATAQYHFIGCTLGSGPESRINEMIGDGLVQISSSTAARIADADTAVLFNSNHMRLLNHPAIYAQIRQRLGSKPALKTA